MALAPLTSIRETRMASRTSRPTSCLWLLTCFVGCGTQITLLAIAYMNYEVSTSIVQSLDRDTPLPAITLGASLLNLIRWDDARIRSVCHLWLPDACRNGSLTLREILHHLSQTSRIQRMTLAFGLMERFNISDLFDISLSTDDLIANRLVMSEKSEFTFEPLDQVFEKTEFMIGLIKAVNLRWKKEVRVTNYRQVKRRFMSPGIFSTLILHPHVHHRLDFMVVTYSENSETIFNGFFDFLMTSVEREMTSSTYDTYVSHFLRHPFPSRCLDYPTDLGFESPGECFDVCLRRQLVPSCGRMPLGVRLTPRDTGIRSMTPVFLADSNKWRSVAAVERECDARCSRRECTQRVYVSRPKSLTQLQQDAENLTLAGHVSFLPSAPVTETLSLPKVTLMEFATNVAATFGFWLGVSVLTSFAWLERLVRTLISRQTDRRRERGMPRQKRQPPWSPVRGKLHLQQSSEYVVRLMQRQARIAREAGD